MNYMPSVNDLIATTSTYQEENQDKKRELLSSLVVQSLKPRGKEKAYFSCLFDAFLSSGQKESIHDFLSKQVDNLKENGIEHCMVAHEQFVANHLTVS